MEIGETKKQRIVIKIDDVQHTGIAKTEKSPRGLEVEVKGLVDEAGNKHENLGWLVQNMRPGKWLNYEIVSLEDVVDEEIKLTEE